MNVDTVQFAAITDRLARTEAKLGEVFEIMEDACRAAGISSVPAVKPAWPGPRHARPRGHLRLVQGSGR